MRLADRERSFLDRCRSRILGRAIEWHDHLDSTQDRAARLAREGAGEGQLVAAGRQGRGRGRAGSAFISPPGGLWVSIVLYPISSPDRALLLTRVVAEVVRDCLAIDFGVPAALKEPNDVMVAGCKICGILAEASTRSGERRLESVVIGLGLNVKNELPGELEAIATRLADHLAIVPDLEILLSRIIERFEVVYAPWTSCR